MIDVIVNVNNENGVEIAGSRNPRTDIGGIVHADEGGGMIGCREMFRVSHETETKFSQSDWLIVAWLMRHWLRSCL